MENSLQIQIRRTKDLNDAEQAEIAQLCSQAHRHDFSLLFTHLPSDGLHIIGYLDDRMVGHAVVTSRWAQPQKLPILRTAYVDAVSVLPGLWGKGYGSAVMLRLAAEISGYEIGCLVTDKMHFYERLGWQEWRGPLAGRAKDGSLKPTADQKGIMVLPLRLTPPLELNGLLTIECQAGRIW